MIMRLAFFEQDYWFHILIPRLINNEFIDETTPHFLAAGTGDITAFFSKSDDIILRNFTSTAIIRMPSYHSLKNKKCHCFTNGFTDEEQLPDGIITRCR